MEYSKKERVRDTSRLYKSIEKNRRMEDLQADLEQKLKDEELKEFERQKIKCEADKVRTQELQQKYIEKEKRKKSEHMEDHRRYFEEIIIKAKEICEKREQEVI